MTERATEASEPPPETTPDVDPDHTIDNRGRGCANGIVRVQRALADLPDGAVLLIRSTDRRAKVEYPELAERTPHELLAIESERRGLLRTEYDTYLRIRRDDPAPNARRETIDRTSDDNDSPNADHE